ncbi:MotA/TolQ/ExbB proton channel family protein [Thiomicrospira sp. R3]|uniref:motility protein A n=1 Tax=Thiomicrospira sp. R3 TaxID=3035472 RepID=UPI00259B5B3F|nr:MotA/TolQ/ExbB proton channel family protein [Thiomicrospira sp. R3]WFE68915.1 MotA/TolQ/ExbB proton channel family protein [Thiomicrospira sp. R3]
MSKSATILGLLFGLIILLLSMVDPQTGKLIDAFLNWQGLLVVLGGTFAAVLINYPLSQLGCIFNGFTKVLTSEPSDVTRTIERIEELSHQKLKGGILVLEKQIDQIDDPFLRFSISQMLIYNDEGLLMASLRNNQHQIQLRHQQCQELFHNMASYAPAFGMMGTVMGLIIMMTAHASSSSAMVDSANMLAGLMNGMGLALVTTFYGVLFANLLFVPIAGKLKVLSEAELLKNEVIIKGIQSLKHSHSPILVRESLLTFVNERTKEKLVQSF